MEYLRKDSIVRVITHPKKEQANTYRYWLSNPTWLGLIRRQPGVYELSGLGFSEFKSLQPLENEVLDNGVLYFKPHVDFEHKFGKKTSKFFETTEEFNIFVEDFMTSSNAEWVCNE